MPHTTRTQLLSSRRSTAINSRRRLRLGAECCRFREVELNRPSVAFGGCAGGASRVTVKRMNTHTNPQFHPAAPRMAGRPGKHASGPVTERTLLRDGRADRLLRLEEVLVILGVARSTWDRWRRSGITPPFVHLPNGSIRVWESDLVRWTRAQEVA